MDFSRDETTAIITLGVTSGIILSLSAIIKLNEGFIRIDLNGLGSLLLITLGMIASVWWHEMGHKVVSGAIGYRTHTEAYYPGQVIGVVLGLFTFGGISFFTPNTPDLEAIPLERIHKHRKYENFKQQAFIAASGILATAALVIVLHGISVFSGSSVIERLVLGNVLLMAYSLIPFELLSFYLLRFQQSIEQLPQSDGLYILHYSPIAYVTTAAFALVLGALVIFTTSVPLWFALIISLLAGLIVWHRFFLEQN